MSDSSIFSFLFSGIGNVIVNRFLGVLIRKERGFWHGEGKDMQLERVDRYLTQRTDDSAKQVDSSRNGPEDDYLQPVYSYTATLEISKSRLGKGIYISGRVKLYYATGKLYQTATLRGKGTRRDPGWATVSYELTGIAGSTRYFGTMLLTFTSNEEAYGYYIGKRPDPEERAAKENFVAGPFRLTKER